VVEFWVVFDGKFGTSGPEREDVVGGSGCSLARIRSVSAATIPPIECPIRIVCTEGSIAGDGVECATSISITLFSSLGIDIVSLLVAPSFHKEKEGGNLRLSPISKPRDTFFKLSSSLKLRICYRHDIDLWQCMADESTEMLRKAPKRIIASLGRHVLAIEWRVGEWYGRGRSSGAYLEAVNEHEEQCFAHAHQLRPMVSSASSLTVGIRRVVVYSG
jgi:hypothetical protein